MVMRFSIARQCASRGSFQGSMADSSVTGIVIGAEAG
jgi:hypothetical protein